MAKINIELELDWLEEDETIDSAVKDQIFDQLETRVMKSVAQSLRETVLKKTESKIDELLQDMATNAISERIEAYLNTPRNVTDRYGDVIRENVTIEDMLKEKIEKAFGQPTLDRDGKKTTYKPVYSLFGYLSTKPLEKLVNEHVVEKVAETQKQIKQLVADRVKTHVADNLTNMILENSTALKLKD